MDKSSTISRIATLSNKRINGEDGADLKHMTDDVQQPRRFLMIESKKAIVLVAACSVILGILVLLFSTRLIDISKLMRAKKSSKGAISTAKITERGTSAYKQGQFERAIKDFKSVVSARPKDAEARYMLGITYQGAGKYDAAIVELEKAVELDPKMAKGYYQLGIAHRSKGSTKAAYRALEKCIHLAPDLGGARLILAQMYTKDKKFDKAIEQYESLLELKLQGMNLAEVHNELGLVYIEKGDIDRAKSEWNSALAIDPGNSRAKELLAKH